MGQSKLLISVVAGAVVGAALSMLDRTTREKNNSYYTKDEGSDFVLCG